jgi:hypothetical protein
MKCWLSILAFMGLAVTSWPASAADGLLHMRCDWQKTTDMKSLQTEKTSGSADFFYDPISDLTGTMRKEGFDSPFVAATRDNLIEGIAHYEADGSPAEQRVEINRYTGAIMNAIKTVKGSQVLEGTCKRISGPDFGAGTGDQ